MRSETVSIAVRGRPSRWLLKLCSVISSSAALCVALLVPVAPTLARWQRGAACCSLVSQHSFPSTNMA